MVFRFEIEMQEIDLSLTYLVTYSIFMHVAIFTNSGNRFGLDLRSELLTPCAGSNI